MGKIETALTSSKTETDTTQRSTQTQRGNDQAVVAQPSAGEVSSDVRDVVSIASSSQGGIGQATSSVYRDFFIEGKAFPLAFVILNLPLPRDLQWHILAHLSVKDRVALTSVDYAHYNRRWVCVDDASQRYGILDSQTWVFDYNDYRPRCESDCESDCEGHSEDDHASVALGDLLDRNISRTSFRSQSSRQIFVPKVRSLRLDIDIFPKNFNTFKEWICHRYPKFFASLEKVSIKIWTSDYNSYADQAESLQCAFEALSKTHTMQLKKLKVTEEGVDGAVPLSSPGLSTISDLILPASPLYELISIPKEANFAALEKLKIGYVEFLSLTPESVPSLTELKIPIVFLDELDELKKRNQEMTFAQHANLRSLTLGICWDRDYDFSLLKTGLFERVHQLRSLTLKGFSAKQGGFFGGNDQASLSQLTHLRLRCRTITMDTTTLLRFPNLQELTIAPYRYAFFNLESFHSNSLKRLSIDATAISLLKQAFSSLPALERLSLRITEKSYLPANIFAAFPATTKVFLDVSDKVCFDYYTFARCSATVSMRLHSLDEKPQFFEIFPSGVGLRALDLSLPSADVSVLPKSYFFGFHYLEYLTVELANFEKRPQHLLNPLTTLKHLSMTIKNKMTLDKEALEALSALTFIRLNVGNLTLSEDVFDENTALETIVINLPNAAINAFDFNTKLTRWKAQLPTLKEVVVNGKALFLNGQILENESFSVGYSSDKDMSPRANSAAKRSRLLACFQDALVDEEGYLASPSEWKKLSQGVEGKFGVTHAEAEH